jgi:hypothetical protein
VERLVHVTDKVGQELKRARLNRFIELALHAAPERTVSPERQRQERAAGEKKTQRTVKGVFCSDAQMDV